MRILGISAGTKDGSNDSLVKEALMGAQEEGAEIEFIRLFDLNIKPCTGCIGCVISHMTGKGGKCVLKDDFDWLLGHMLDADGIVLSSPIFEKGAAGITHLVCDRFGPRTDRGHIIISSKIAEESPGGILPDQRLLKSKPISFMGIGGSDWSTRVECDHAMLAMSPMWTVIDNIVFQWSKTIVVEDEKVERAHRLGVDIARAAADPENMAYVGDFGVCPHCHSKEFYFNTDTGRAICCLCGIEGDIEKTDRGYKFVFEDKWLEHAHDTMSGKFKHADDIRENEGRLMTVKDSVDYKIRIQRYKDFIAATVPQ